MLMLESYCTQMARQAIRKHAQVTTNQLTNTMPYIASAQSHYTPLTTSSLVINYLLIVLLWTTNSKIVIIVKLLLYVSGFV